MLTFWSNYGTVEYHVIQSVEESIGGDELLETFETINDESIPYHEKIWHLKPSWIYIASILVDSKYRGKGHGSELLAAFLKKHEGCGFVLDACETHDGKNSLNYDELVSWYKRKGFRNIKEGGETLYLF